MRLPVHVVIDTNVAVTANGKNDGAPFDCVVASARALKYVIDNGHVYIDVGGAIIAEYKTYLRAAGQPGPGDVFYKWLLTHQWGNRRVTRVPITPKAEDNRDYEELPEPTDGTEYDPSDKKFLAVAVAHPRRPQILQSFDSKWWGWRAALEAAGVSVHFLCPKAIETKYREKMT